MEAALGGSLEVVVEVAEVVDVALAAGASTTSAVARGSPSVLGAATELLLGAGLAVALAWEVAVAMDSVVELLDSVVELLVSVAELLVSVVAELLVSVVLGLALVEVLAGSALAVEGLALAGRGHREGSARGWGAAGTPRDLAPAHPESGQSRK